MEVVKSVEEFAKKNEKELVAFMCSKTGIYDKQVIHDTIQDFYVKLIKSKALETYDPAKGAFATYMCNLFCWLLSLQGKRHFRIKYKAISRIPGRRENFSGVSSDVWDAVVSHGWSSQTRLKHPINSMNLYDEHLAETKYPRQIDSQEHLAKKHKSGAHDLCFTSFSVDPTYLTAATTMEEELFLKLDYDSFKSYIQNTENPKRARQMLDFLKYRVDGCSPGAIAPLMKTTCAMIRVLKNNVLHKFEEWKGKDA